MSGAVTRQKLELNVTSDATYGIPIPSMVVQPLSLSTSHSNSVCATRAENTASMWTNGSTQQVFAWRIVDNVRVPCVVRNESLFVPVRILEQKLLRPLMAAGPSVSSIKRPLLASYYVTPDEAAALTYRAGNTDGAFVAGVDLVVSYDEFSVFYNELKAVCASHAAESVCSGGWVQINNSVIPYVNIDGEKYLPLSVVQNAARLLSEADPSSLLLRHMSPSACHYMNESCRLTGLQFTVDSTTDVVGLRTICALARRTPVVRFLPNVDPFSNAKYVDLGGNENTCLSNCIISPLVQQVQQVLPALDSTNQNSVGIKIVDVRGNAVSECSGVPTVINEFHRHPSSLGRTISATPSSATAVGEQLISSSADSHPVVEPIVFRNRTVSSLRRHDGKNYVLLEAICRVFFPSLSVDAFVHCVEHELHAPVSELTDSEQHYFIEFYRLPTNCLRCRKLISVENFEHFFPQIEHNFGTREVRNGEAAAHSEMKDCVVTDHPSNLKTLDTRFDLAADQTRSTSKTSLRKRKNFCCDVIVIDD